VAYAVGDLMCSSASPCRLQQPNAWRIAVTSDLAWSSPLPALRAPLAATLGIKTGDPWFFGKRFSERGPNLVKLQQSMRLFSRLFSAKRSAWLAQGRLNGARARVPADTAILAVSMSKSSRLILPAMHTTRWEHLCRLAKAVTARARARSISAYAWSCSAMPPGPRLLTTNRMTRKADDDGLVSKEVAGSRVYRFWRQPRAIARRICG